MAKGMAVRSGLDAVEHAHGKPLPPPEQLQLDKMHLVGLLPNAEVLGATQAKGLGAGQIALYASGFANDQCFLRAGDLIFYHKKLQSGELSRATEAYVGFIAVPVQPLPRLGATGQRDLQQAVAAKFLAYRCKVVNTTANRSASGQKELRFLTGGGTGTKLDLGDLHDITRQVLPYDNECVRVVRAAPALASQLYGGFGAHISAVFAIEPLLQPLRDAQLLSLKTLEDVEAVFTQPEGAGGPTANISARAAAVLRGAVQNVASSKKGHFKSVSGAAKSTQQDLAREFGREADGAKLLVEWLFEPRGAKTDLAAALVSAKKESLPDFLKPESTGQSPQNAISGAAKASAAAAQRVSRAASATPAAAQPQRPPKRAAAEATAIGGAATVETPPPKRPTGEDSRSSKTPSPTELLQDMLSGKASASVTNVAKPEP